jgi:hypothetical protein
MLKHKKGDKIRVTRGDGTVVDAIFLSLSYPKDPKHYAIEIRKPTKLSKTGFVTKVWYLPETRFVD